MNLQIENEFKGNFEKLTKSFENMELEYFDTLSNRVL